MSDDALLHTWPRGNSFKLRCPKLTDPAGAEVTDGAGTCTVYRQDGVTKLASFDAAALTSEGSLYYLSVTPAMADEGIDGELVKVVFVVTSPTKGTLRRTRRSRVVEP
ncbi:MAG: hypothetical protein ACJ8AO_20235 [Gemmatimonadaceae bacterium]